MSARIELTLNSAAATADFAAALATRLAAGDLLVLSGELGAGKTTFTQGLGRGLGVREGIISPTFVLVRIHPNMPTGPRPGGPDLVHVDAYRLTSPGEIDDIDLENTMDSAVTVVEWGAGRVEHLSDSRLEIQLLRATGGTGPDLAFDAEAGADDDADREDEPRVLTLNAVGPRWADTDWAEFARGVEPGVGQAAVQGEA